MAIDIKKVVNTNFIVQQTQVPIGSYKAVLYVTNSSSETYDAMAKVIFAALGGSTSSKYFKTLNITGVSDIGETILTQKRLVSGTEEDFVFVVFNPAINANILGDPTLYDPEDPPTLPTVLTKITNADAPYKLIPCISMSKTMYTTAYDGTTPANSGYASILATSTMKEMPMAIKLHVNDSDPVGICVAAYYCSLNLNDANMLQDYCFTKEGAVFGTGTIGDSGVNQLTVLGLTDLEYDTYKDNTNFTDIVGNSTVNFGGNLYNGIAITSQFGLIAVENDITYSVLKTMLNKQYLTAQGLNNIVAVINDAITRYVYNGYLMQNAEYTGDTYEESYNGVMYTMIKKGAALPQGYYVATISMSKIKAEDRRDHKFTPIRVFMQTQTGARVVEINGTIIE